MLVQILILKHLKILQHISIITQVIFRDLGRFLFKVIELKIVKNHCGDAGA